MLQNLTTWQRKIRQIKFACQLKLNPLRVLVRHPVDLPDFILKFCGRISRCIASRKVDSIKKLLTRPDACDLCLQWVVKRKQR